MNNVFITSYDIITSLGVGPEESINTLKSKKNTIYLPEQNNIFNKPYFAVNFDLGFEHEGTLCSKLALKLLKNFEPKWLKYAPLPLIMATSTGGIKETEEAYTQFFNKGIKRDLKNKDYFYDTIHYISDIYGDKISEAYTFSTACSSAGHSLLHAYHFMKNNLIKKALVLAVDALSITTMFGFDSLKLVSEKGTKPLTLNRDGLSLGEGGAIILLEIDPEDNPIAEIVGIHSNSDGYHITSPNPEGTQQAECITKSLEMAGLKAEDIGYINAHGTGTLTNDEIEMKVIKSIFTDKPVVSSLKGFIGHTVGSSALIELILAIEMLKNKTVFQPENMGEPIDKDYVPQQTISHSAEYFLKNSFGFGGNNVSFIVKNHF